MELVMVGAVHHVVLEAMVDVVYVMVYILA